LKCANLLIQKCKNENKNPPYLSFYCKRFTNNFTSI
jgi:hypothetical protein